MYIHNHHRINTYSSTMLSWSLSRVEIHKSVLETSVMQCRNCHVKTLVNRSLDMNISSRSLSKCPLTPMRSTVIQGQRFLKWTEETNTYHVCHMTYNTNILLLVHYIIVLCPLESLWNGIISLLSSIIALIFYLFFVSSSWYISRYLERRTTRLHPCCICSCKKDVHTHTHICNGMCFMASGF